MELTAVVNENMTEVEKEVLKQLLLRIGVSEDELEQERHKQATKKTKHPTPPPRNILTVTKCKICGSYIIRYFVLTYSNDKEGYITSYQSPVPLPNCEVQERESLDCLACRETLLSFSKEQLVEIIMKRRNCLWYGGK